MSVFVLIVAGLAAALHVLIFSMESLAWDGELAQKTFGKKSPEELQITRFYAFNQGIYNLALAVITFVGMLLFLMSDAAGSPSSMSGLALILAGCGSMLFAALALGLTSPPHRAAAVKQGFFPLLSVIGAVVLLAL